MESNIFIQIMNVEGSCTCGLKKDQIFFIGEDETPSANFCGEAFYAAFPMILGISADSNFYFEKEKNTIYTTCPSGKVRFKISKGVKNVCV